jgi:hypothetical protein
MSSAVARALHFRVQIAFACLPVCRRLVRAFSRKPLNLTGFHRLRYCLGRETCVSRTKGLHPLPLRRCAFRLRNGISRGGTRRTGRTRRTRPSFFSPRPPRPPREAGSRTSSTQRTVRNGNQEIGTGSEPRLPRRRGRRSRIPPESVAIKRLECPRRTPGRKFLTRSADATTVGSECVAKLIAGTLANRDGPAPKGPPATARKPVEAEGARSGKGRSGAPVRAGRDGRAGKRGVAAVFCRSSRVLEPTPTGCTRKSRRSRP